MGGKTSGPIQPSHTNFKPVIEELNAKIDSDSAKPQQGKHSQKKVTASETKPQQTAGNDLPTHYVPVDKRDIATYSPDNHPSEDEEQQSTESTPPPSVPDINETHTPVIAGTPSAHGIVNTAPPPQTPEEQLLALCHSAKHNTQIVGEAKAIIRKWKPSSGAIENFVQTIESPKNKYATTSVINLLNNKKHALNKTHKKAIRGLLIRAETLNKKSPHPPFTKELHDCKLAEQSISASEPKAHQKLNQLKIKARELFQHALNGTYQNQEVISAVEHKDAENRLTPILEKVSDPHTLAKLEHIAATHAVFDDYDKNGKPHGFTGNKAFKTRYKEIKEAEQQKKEAEISNKTVNPNNPETDSTHLNTTHPATIERPTTETGKTQREEPEPHTDNARITKPSLFRTAIKLGPTLIYTLWETTKAKLSGWTTTLRENAKVKLPGWATTFKEGLKNRFSNFRQKAGSSKEQDTTTSQKSEQIPETIIKDLEQPASPQDNLEKAKAIIKQKKPDLNDAGDTFDKLSLDDLKKLAEENPTAIRKPLIPIFNSKLLKKQIMEYIEGDSAEPELFRKGGTRTQIKNMIANDKKILFTQMDGFTRPDPEFNLSSTTKELWRERFPGLTPLFSAQSLRDFAQRQKPVSDRILFEDIAEITSRAFDKVCNMTKDEYNQVWQPSNLYQVLMPSLIGHESAMTFQMDENVKKPYNTKHPSNPAVSITVCSRAYADAETKKHMKAFVHAWKAYKNPDNEKAE